MEVLEKLAAGACDVKNKIQWFKKANKNVVSNKRSSQTKCSVSSVRFSAPFLAAMGNIYISKFKYIECLKSKIVQCSVHKSVQCWNAKPCNVQFTKVSSAGMQNRSMFSSQKCPVLECQKGNVEQCSPNPF